MNSLETLDSCILCGSSKISPLFEERNIYRCKECFHIFDNPRPTQEAIEKHYSQKGKYDHWIESDKSFTKYWNVYLKRVLKYKKSGKLLDIGAGIGMFLSLAKKYFDVTGTELSDEGISVAKERYNLDFVKGSLETIDLGNKKFDIITMSQILEHLPFPGETLAYMKTLLNDNGLVYITVPNEAPYSFRMVLTGFFSITGIKRFRDFNMAGYRKLQVGKMDEIHLSHFSEKTLVNALKTNGFEILETTIEFHDLFMRYRGPVQIIRYFMLGIAKFFKITLKINLYNSFGVIAKKKDNNH